MPSLKDLKNRIESVKSTRKITKAMQMVAAAKLRRAQEAAEAGRPYAERMQAVMSSLAASVGTGEGAPRLLAGTGSDKTHLLVVMTSERGLCGGFNSSIVRLARARVAELQAAGKTVKIITVGKKGREQLRRDYGSYVIGHVDLSDVKRIGYVNAQAIAKDILARFDAEEFDVATIFFNRFQSVISQIPTAQQIIPAKLDAAAGSETETASTVYDYEPSEEAILADLLPRGVATQIFTALLENGASEQGARMSAMDNATRNAGDMIDKLTIQYNRSRQAAITKELIEIISGAEAL
ncbi:F0F1 ATP synthase subunit gamma [Solirhodobacter olei]|uniref:F0F1 ATP synthase subunit gamma n=1 Tax=Solirhodobacter olei TaxID=2493082 RepID=UPI000FD9E974|nr:F0F1 ATP synthase subunit gamma [Solirhodobacter olei]